MDNLKRPAHPQPIAFADGNDTAQTAWGVHDDFAGFTKLEKAALMIAQGFAYNYAHVPGQSVAIAERAVELAKAVLEEANK